MSINKKLSTAIGFLGLAAYLTLASATAQAQSSAGSQLKQSVSAGALSTEFTNSSGATVSNPTFQLSAVTTSTEANMVSTGQFATNTQRATVDNPGAAAAFSLDIAATNPAIGWYEDSTPAVSVYKHNGATAGEGQLSITSAGTVAAYTGTVTGISGATPGTFTGATPISLMTGAIGMDSIWRGYVYNVGISQIIPSSTPSGSYSIDLTQTVTAG